MFRISPLLWLPTIFGILLGSLSIVSVVAQGFMVELGEIPMDIVLSYRGFTSLLSLYLLELPFDIYISQLWADLTVIWLVLGGSNLRAATVSEIVWNITTNRTKGLPFFSDEPRSGLAQGLVSFVTISWLLVGGGLASIYVFWTTTKSCMWLQGPVAKKIYSDVDAAGKRAGYKHAENDNRKLDMQAHISAILILFSAIGINVLAAVLFFMWNAAEIERVNGMM